MTTRCAVCPLRPHGCFTPMSEDEARFMQEFKTGELTIDAGTTVLLEGSNSPQLYTALHGLGLRYKLLEDGRRQVINLVFPGDFIGLQAGVMREMKHTVEAVTPMTLCVFSRSNFWSVFKSHPERAFDLTWIAAQEEHFLGETLTSLGQRSGVERVAWGLVKIYKRAESLGLARNGTMDFPFRQADIADAFGLSLVHTNRTLRTLREKQVAAWQSDTLKIFDMEELARIGATTTDAPPPRPLF